MLSGPLVVARQAEVGSAEDGEGGILSLAGSELGAFQQGSGLGEALCLDVGRGQRQQDLGTGAHGLRRFG